MNKTERKKVGALANTLEDIKSQLETMSENECEKFENLPEGLQDSDRGDAMQECIENFEEAISNIEEAIGYLNEITEG